MDAAKLDYVRWHSDNISKTSFLQLVEKISYVEKVKASSISTAARYETKEVGQVLS